MIPLLVKFPTRSRPDRFKYALELYVRHCTRKRDVHFLFSLDTDDPTLPQLRKIIYWACVRMCLPGKGVAYSIVEGTSTGKIHAVNRDVPEFDRPWKTLIVASDDMHAQPKWDVWVIDSMQHYFPNGDGALWFADGFQKDICTIPCIGRAEYDRTGYIYNPAYLSVFADDEQTHSAIQRGKMVKIDTVIMRHDHPAWNSSLTPDALYRRNETPEIWDHDKSIYHKRRAAGFPC